MSFQVFDQNLPKINLLYPTQLKQKQLQLFCKVTIHHRRARVTHQTALCPRQMK